VEIPAVGILAVDIPGPVAALETRAPQEILEILPQCQTREEEAAAHLQQQLDGLGRRMPLPALAWQRS
jgi:hypothetical protein